MNKSEAGEKQSLLGKSELNKKRRFRLVGSLVEIDDIEKASKEIANDFNACIEQSAAALGDVD